MKLLKGLLILVLGGLLGAGGMYYYLNVEPTQEEVLDQRYEVNGVYFQKIGIDENNTNQLQVALQSYGVEHRTLIEKESNVIAIPNMYTFMYSTKDVNNIYLFDIDSEVFASLDYNYIEYMNQTQNPTLLTMSLKKDEVLVVKVLETESVPATLLRFDIDGVPYYWVIQYDGRGTRMLIEDIHRVE